MRNLKRIILGIGILLAGISCKSVPALEGVQTFVYSVKGADSLKLDVYNHAGAAIKDGRKPVFLFVHGGGWEEGSRVSDNTRLYEGFAEKGFLVVSIDYRLGYLEARKEGQIPDKSISPDLLAGTLDEPAKMAALKRGMTEGVEDLYDATSFVVKHAKEWGADASAIILGGSSAGACIVLQAEYGLCNGDEVAKQRLPKGFKYAGVVSGAGALWSFDGKKLAFGRKPCPIMLIHGKQDQLIPYTLLQFASSDMTCYGSEKIADMLDGLDVPCWFVSCENADHCIAGLPFVDSQDEIVSFIRRAVLDKEQLSVRSQEYTYDRPRTIINMVKERWGMTDEEIRRILDQNGLETL